MTLPLVADLAESVEEDAYLAVMRRGEVAVAEVVRASQRLHLADPGVGFSRVAHVAAVGKALLAACPRRRSTTTWARAPWPPARATRW